MNMTFAKLREAITTNHFGPEDLDPIVHEILSEEASSINNNGMDAQLTFLIQRIGQDEILKKLGISKPSK